MIEGLQNKEVRQEFQRTLALGFTFAGNDASGHVVLRAPSRAEIKMASSPSARHWRREFRHSVARALGLSVWQVERLAAGQGIQKKVKSKRRVSPRKPRRSLVVADNPARPDGSSTTGAGVDLRDPAEKPVDEVRANWEQAQADRIRRGERLPWKSAA